jgi:hypothetical protein
VSLPLTVPHRSSRLVTASVVVLAIVSVAAFALVVFVLMQGHGFTGRLLGMRVRVFDHTRPIVLGTLSSALLFYLGRRVAAMRVGALTLLALFGILALVGIAGTGPPKVPEGDMAVLESYTIRAARGELLVGPYSRFFWNHPGPLYFYLQAPFHVLTSYRSEALWAGALTLNLTALGVVFWVALRKGGSLLGLSIAGLSGFFLWRVSDMLTSPWNPHVLVLPLMALVMVAASMAIGSLALFPAVAFLATFVGQTHVGLVPVVVAVAGLATLLALVFEDRENRENRKSRASSIDWRRVLRIANATAWLLLVLWMLPLAEELHAAKGNLSRLWEFFFVEERTGQRLSTAFNAWAEMISGVLSPWLRVGWGGELKVSGRVWLRYAAVLQLVALAGIAALGAKKGNRFPSVLAGILCLAWIVAGWSVTRIEDALVDHAVFWITGLGVLGTSVIASAVLDVTPLGRWLSTRIAAAACAAIWIWCVTMGVQRLNARVARASDPTAAERQAQYFVHEIKTYLHRNPRLKPLIRIDQEAWPVAAGAIVQLQKDKVPFAVERQWLFMFSGAAAANGDENMVVLFLRPELYQRIMEEPGRGLLAAHNDTYVVIDTTGDLLHWR